MCVWLYVLCVFGSLCAVHPSAVQQPVNMSHLSSGGLLCVIGSLCWSLSFGNSLSRCPIFRQVAYCVTVCLVCNSILVLVRMSHYSAIICPFFINQPTAILASYVNLLFIDSLHVT